MLTAIAFVVITMGGIVLSFIRGPFWGLLVYANLYFNSPDPNINWWAEFLPSIRWGIIVSGSLLMSVGIHYGKLPKVNASCFLWVVIFFLLSILVVIANGNIPESKIYLYYLFTYVVISFVFIKIINNYKTYNLFCLALILFLSNLSINAHLYGKRIHARLEGIGTSDANGSNEFGLLIAAILPLLIPYILKGSIRERILCCISLPLLVNAYILCNSRGSFVALLGGGVIGFGLADKKIKKMMILGGVLAIPLFLYLADKEFFVRIGSLLQTKNALQDFDVASQISSLRTEIWIYSLGMIKDHPFGAGLNGFKHLAHLYMPSNILNNQDMSYGYGIRSAQNTYLQVLVEQGVLGLFLFVGLCLKALKSLAASFRDVSRASLVVDKASLQIIALFVSLCVTLLGGLFTSRLYFEFFWWQIALANIVGRHSFFEKLDSLQKSSKISA